MTRIEEIRTRLGELKEQSHGPISHHPEKDRELGEDSRHSHMISPKPCAQDIGYLLPVAEAADHLLTCLMGEGEWVDTLDAAEELRAALNPPCLCAGPGSYDAPHIDCPHHGGPHDEGLKEPYAKGVSRRGAAG